MVSDDEADVIATDLSDAGDFLLEAFCYKSTICLLSIDRRQLNLLGYAINC